MQKIILLINNRFFLNITVSLFHLSFAKNSLHYGQIRRASPVQLSSSSYQLLWSSCHMKYLQQPKK